MRSFILFVLFVCLFPCLCLLCTLFVHCFICISNSCICISTPDPPPATAAVPCEQPLRRCPVLLQRLLPVPEPPPHPAPQVPRGPHRQSPGARAAAQPDGRCPPLPTQEGGATVAFYCQILLPTQSSVDQNFRCIVLLGKLHFQLPVAGKSCLPGNLLGSPPAFRPFALGKRLSQHVIAAEIFSRTLPVCSTAALASLNASVASTHPIPTPALAPAPAPAAAAVPPSEPSASADGADAAAAPAPLPAMEAEEWSVYSDAHAPNRSAAACARGGGRNAQPNGAVPEGLEGH